MKDIRAQAAKSIARVIAKGESFTGDVDVLQSQNGDKENIQLDSRDRGFYRELCFGTLRYYHQLNALLSPLLKKPFNKKDADIHALLLIGLYQLLFLRTPDHAAISASVNAAKKLKKPWASGLVNAVLRNFLRQQKALDITTATASLQPADKASHPQWLYQKLVHDWPAQQQSIIDYNNSQPAMSLRVNLAKSSRDDYQQQLRKLGIETTVNPVFDDEHSGCLGLEKAVAVSELPAFDQGWVSVQDPGAQLAAKLLNLTSGMRVLDACAAPGGKTTHILEMAEDCLLTVIDSSSERLQLVKENLLRHGFDPAQNNAQLNCIHTDSNNTQSWWDGQPFDRILLDAPCSGTGIISHHPDIKLLRRESDIEKFASQQKALLNNLWPLLAEGGELLYCTCSIMPEENAKLIKWFLDQTSSATLIPIEAKWGEPLEAGRQLLPISGKNGGFFYARLSKSGRV